MHQPSFTQSFTKEFHKEPYKYISPTNDLVSAAGKTIIITGGHQGIGLAITQSFAQAGAAHIVIIARRGDVLAAAKADLEAAHQGTRFHTFVGSLTDHSRIQAIGDEIRRSIAEPDILILNAAYLAPVQVTLQGEIAELSPSFDTNVTGNVHLIDQFVGKAPHDNKAPKVVIDINSASLYMFGSPSAGAYGASKAAFGRLLATFQTESIIGSPKWPANIRFHSIHPGCVFTEGCRSCGMTEDMFPWDAPTLPGHFAVWLASPDADFLKGRYVWANWDAEEMVARKEEIVQGDTLRIGIVCDAKHPVNSGMLDTSKFENR